MILHILGTLLTSMSIVSVGLCVAQMCRRRASAQLETQLTLELLRQEFAASARARAARETEQPAWLGYRNFLVERKIKDGPSSDSFYLIPQDGRPLPAFQPGQFVSVRVRMPGQAPDRKEIVERRYPITSDPNEHFYCISIERLPDMVLSGCLHQGIAAGTVVDVMAPRGELCLDTKRCRPVVLVADGVGTRPCISMLETATESNPDRAVTVVYGVRNGRDHGIRERLEQLATRLPNLRHFAVEAETNSDDSMESCRLEFAGTISLNALKGLLPSNNFDFQLWGPSLMVESMKQALGQWGVADHRVRAEVFGAPLAPVIANLVRQERPVVGSTARTMTWKPVPPAVEDAAPEMAGHVLKNPAYRSRNEDISRRAKRRARVAIG